MGFSGNQVVDGTSSVIAGIPLRAPLKPLYVKKERVNIDEDEDCSTTPRGEEARIPARLTCPPPPPRKRKPSLKCNYGGGGGGGREFFIAPDLETVFIRRHLERASS